MHGVLDMEIPCKIYSVLSFPSSMNSKEISVHLNKKDDEILKTSSKSNMHEHFPPSPLCAARSRLARAPVSLSQPMAAPPTPAK